MSCKLFPKIGTNKLMAVIISRLRGLMMHKRRALNGEGCRKGQNKNGYMRRRGKEQRSNDTKNS